MFNFHERDFVRFNDECSLFRGDEHVVTINGQIIKTKFLRKNDRV